MSSNSNSAKLKKCATCGKGFSPRAANHRFCAPPCHPSRLNIPKFPRRALADRWGIKLDDPPANDEPEAPKKCAVCGVVVKPQRSFNNRQVIPGTCSPSCREEAFTVLPEHLSPSASQSRNEVAWTIGLAVRSPREGK